MLYSESFTEPLIFALLVDGISHIAKSRPNCQPAIECGLSKECSQGQHFVLYQEPRDPKRSGLNKDFQSGLASCRPDRAEAKQVAFKRIRNQECSSGSSQAQALKQKHT